MKFFQPLPVSTNEPEAFATRPIISHVEIADMPRQPHPDDYAVPSLIHPAVKPDKIPFAPFAQTATEIEFELVPNLPTKFSERVLSPKLETVVSEDPRPASNNRWHIGKSDVPNLAKPAKGRVI